MDHCMKLTKTLFTTFLGASIFAFPSATWANTVEEQFQQGLAASEKGDHQSAFQFWKPLAEEGDVRAQFNLGVMYSKGEGIKQDYFEAAKWFRKAAEQGNASAQLNLGVMYANGYGVPQDKNLAKEWILKACENHHQKACEAITIK